MKTFVALLSLVLAFGPVAGATLAATGQMTGDVRGINADANNKLLRGDKAHTFQVLGALSASRRAQVRFGVGGQGRSSLGTATPDFTDDLPALWDTAWLLPLATRP